MLLWMASSKLFDDDEVISVTRATLILGPFRFFFNPGAYTRRRVAPTPGRPPRKEPRRRPGVPLRHAPERTSP